MKKENSRRKEIDAILGSKKIALAGVSRNPQKFGCLLYKELKGKGMDILPLHPELKEYEGVPCYAAPSELPDDVEALITSVKPDKTLSVVQEAHQKGISKIWMQQGSQSDDAVSYCEEMGLTYIAGKCVFLYAEPVESVHKVHRFFSRLFGTYHTA
ncbi:MAG: CoA-binding protein [Spirochaetales bacterium]|nr:CoA-binding protein [Spirochaetales bacterium]